MKKALLLLNMLGCFTCNAAQVEWDVVYVDYEFASTTRAAFYEPFLPLFIQQVGNGVEVSTYAESYMEFANTLALAQEGDVVTEAYIEGKGQWFAYARFADNEMVNVFQGNAKHLPFMKDNEYDIVLLMGPIYSLKDFKERKAACQEALRIVRSGGYVFIAYCLQDAPLIHEIFMSENPAAEINYIGYDRENALVTDNTGSSRILDTIASVDELIDAICAENDAVKVCRFSQDGVSQIISNSVNSMNEDSYKEWIQYLISTAERPDLMGFSDHIVQVLEKR